MHTDARTLDEGSQIEGDLCIIGAGAAGLTIAQELDGTSIEVVLLESGGFQPDPDTQYLYYGEHVGLSDYGLAGARLRFFGGSTNHWSGMCGLLDPIDFEQRDWVLDSGWPIRRQELMPYYERAHPICDLGPFSYDPERWERPASGFTGLPFDSAHIQDKIFRFSPPTDFGEKYRDTVVQSDNVHLYTHANVTGIRLRENAKAVRHLDVKCLTGTSLQVTASDYVLACGGVENPRLLLSSNDVVGAGVGNENDLVGRYFLQHPHVVVGDIVLTNRNRNISFYTEEWPRNTTMRALLRLSDEVQRSEKTLNYNVSLADRAVALPSGYRSAQVLRYALERGRAKTPIFEELSWLLRDFDSVIYGMNRQLQGKDYVAPYRFSLKARLEQAPNPNSRVRLGEERDALGLRRVKVNWQLTDLDRHTLKVANQVLAREFMRSETGRLVEADWLAEGKDWPDNMNGGHHHMGATRMSTTPQSGVVDANCKVHGVGNLFIAGSSVFPTAGAANPTLTLVALALRLTDHLSARA
jgi:choline dehydrogenase-like flavoprotein